MDLLCTLYEQQHHDKHLRRDKAQEAVLPLFAGLRRALVKRQTWLFSWMEAPQGIYLWGGVGRGKTFLMDLFAQSLGPIPCRRQHFHGFMQEVQGRLFTLQKTDPQRDPFAQLAKALRKEAAVLCLDEFFVDHIGDAMILSRLFTALFQEGVVLVTTSNTPPEKLYWKGLQRELLLPFLDLLMQTVKVVHLQGDHDHRQDVLSQGMTYLTPLGPQTDHTLQDLWNRLTDQAPFQPLQLTVKGHTLSLSRTAKSICWASFDALCGQPLGAADYIKILQTFSVLILSDIPDLGRDQFNEARRFITLVDLLYEKRFPTVFSAAVPLAQLYLEGKGAEDFRRTRSRLEEMGSWKI